MKTPITKFNDNYNIYFWIFLVTLVGSFEINYLFYDVSESPDFNKYSGYFDYFFQIQETTEREQGLLYYYLQSLNLKLFYSQYLFSEIILHKSILFVNFLIYIVGIIGFYKLLSFMKFNKHNIFLTMTFLNFFPPVIALRITLKPELLAFAMLPWIVYFLESYSKEKKIIFIYKAIPFAVASLSTKGNALVILSMYLIFVYGKLILKNYNKNILFAILIFLLLFILVTLENNLANKKNIFDIQSGSSQEENYDYKASPSVIYRTNLFKLFTSPIKHSHANSFIAITLLETTGDYFDIYWDNDGVSYFKNRKSLFVFKESNQIVAPEINFNEGLVTIYQQRITDVYVRESLGMIISLLLYLQLFRLIFFDPNYRKYYIAVLFGMVIILFHAISGFPKNNFDPLVGDTFKPIYYSFVLIFSFIFLICRALELKIIKPIHIFLYTILILFILGFPKYNDENLQSSLYQNIQESKLCFIEKNIYLNSSQFDELNCNNKLSEIAPMENKYNFKIIPINTLVLLIILLITYKEILRNTVVALFFLNLKSKIIR